MGDQQFDQFHFLTPRVHLKFVDAYVRRSHQGRCEDSGDIISGHQVDLRLYRQAVQVVH